MADKKDSYLQFLQDKHFAETTGLDFSGRIGGAVGMDKWKRDQETKRPWWSPEPPKKQKSWWDTEDTKATDSNQTVICTECKAKGLMTEADCALSGKHLLEFLSPQHERGYHVWAVRVVRLMRRSPRWSRFFARLANARADHLAYLYGDTARWNLIGATLCAVGHPVCYLIGHFVDEQDWQALYRDDAVRESA